MPASKFRVQASDGDGNLLTVTLEGTISREKVLKLLDLVELMGGIPSSGGDAEGSRLEEESKVERVKALLGSRFPLNWFSSHDLQAAYEEEYGEPLRLSTASTYLMRLSRENLLMRSGSRAQRRYRLNRAVGGKAGGLEP